MKFSLLNDKISIFILYIIITSMLFFPETTLGFRVEDIFLIILLIVVSLNPQKNFKIPSYSFMLFCIYIFILTSSVFYNVNFGDFTDSKYNYQYNNSIDLFIKEVIRASKIFIIVIVCYNLRLNEKQTEKFLSFFLSLSYLLATIGIMQYFNALDINQFISENYNPEGKHNALISESYIAQGLIRINTTFYGPNIYSAFLIIPLAISLKKSVIENQKKHLFGTFLIMINLLFTQSRTGIIIALIMIFSFLFYVSFLSKKINILNFLLYSSIPFIVYYFLSFINIDIVQRFQGVFTSHILETSGRGPAIDQMKDILSTSFLLGYSPVVSNDFPSDNELKIFAHYGGILGVTFYFFLVFMLYKKLKYSLISNANKVFLTTLIISIILVGTSNGFIISNRIFPIFIVIYTLTAYSGSNFKKQYSRFSNCPQPIVKLEKKAPII